MRIGSDNSSSSSASSYPDKIFDNCKTSLDLAYSDPVPPDFRKHDSRAKCIRPTHAGTAHDNCIYIIEHRILQSVFKTNIKTNK